MFKYPDICTVRRTTGFPRGIKLCAIFPRESYHAWYCALFIKKWLKIGQTIIAHSSNRRVQQEEEEEN